MADQRAFNVLVLCTGNSARSILAEGLLNRMCDGRFRAYSAGSKPVGQPNPFAIEYLESMGIDTRFARSKSWQEFASDSGMSIDIVITVCDSAASEVCPIFPGHALMVHWGLPDPAGLADDAESRRAFANTYAALVQRIEALMTLDLEHMTPDDIVVSLNEIGNFKYES